MIALLWVIQAFILADAAKDDVLEFINKGHIGKLLGEGVTEYEVITPLRTDHQGNRIARFQRHTEAEHPNNVYFNLAAFGEKIQLHLQKNQRVVDQDFDFTARNNDGTVTNLKKENTHHCAYHGVHATGTAALTTCDGLSGLIRTRKGDFFIHPMPEHLRSDHKSHEVPHVVFRRETSASKTCALRDADQTSSQVVDELVNMFAKTPNLILVDKDHNSIGGSPFGDNYKGPKNADSADRLTVETAAFVDKVMFEYIKHLYPSNPDQEMLRYVLSIINAIQLIYNEPNFIDIPVQFILIKVEIFKTENVGFELTDSCDTLLDNFCKWQNTINPGNDYDLKHWDHAFMFTGVDIKDDKGSSNVIGVAPMARMCTPRESCTLTETNWFVGVFTGAHEAGHNFGMPHDGDGNECDGHKYIMAPLDEIGQNTWSSCSAKYVKKYLTIPWTICLLDKRGVVAEFDHAKGALPGQRYTADEQCELRLGAGAMHDPAQSLASVCQQLKCKKGSEATAAQPALTGTYCGPDKVCKDGSCQESDVELVKTNGGWGPWNAGSKCESACIKNGIGVLAPTRKCDKPRPTNGGKACSGESFNLKKCDDASLCQSKTSLDQFGKKICNNPPDSAKSYGLTGTYIQNLDDENKACIIFCEINGGRSLQWGVHFPDGTPCSKSISSKYCYQGKCLRFEDPSEDITDQDRYLHDSIEISTIVGDENDFVTDDAQPLDERYAEDGVIEVTTQLGDEDDFITDDARPADDADNE